MSVSVTKRLAALAALTLVLGTVGRTSGQTIIDYSTTIDSPISYGVHVVEGSNPNPPTVVDVEASIWSTLSAFDSSIVNLRLGNTYFVEAYDSSTLNTFDGWGAEVIRTSGSSTLNMFGGSTELLFPSDSSTTNISGGRIWDWITAHDNCVVNISGGNNGRVNAYDASRVSISGGLVEYLDAGSSSGELNSIITIEGSGFNYPYGAIPDPSGTLTGLLANGDPIDVPFLIYDQASIVLVPEPSSLALLGLGAVTLLCLARRRRRATPRWSSV